MKRGWKIFWIICGITALIGIAFCAIGISMGSGVRNLVQHIDDGDFMIVEREKIISDLEEDRTEEFSGVENLEINVIGAQIEILQSEDNRVKVETSRMDKVYKLQIEQSGETLEINTHARLKLINRLNHAGSIRVYIPKQSMNKIEIDCNACSLKVDNLTVKKLLLDVGAGEAELQNFQADEIQLDCGAGSISGSGEILKKGTIDCGVGEIDLQLAGTEKDYRYTVSCGVGEVNVGDHEYSGLGVDAEVGSGEKKLEIDCGVGEIDVKFSDDDYDRDDDHEWDED